MVCLLIISLGCLGTYSVNAAAMTAEMIPKCSRDETKQVNRKTLTSQQAVLVRDLDAGVDPTNIRVGP